MWAGVSWIGSEGHGARTQVRVDPVGPGFCAPAGGKSFDLRRWRSPFRDGCELKAPRLDLETLIHCHAFGALGTSALQNESG